MNASLLQQIQDANKSYLGGASKTLDPAGAPFIVIACIDPRLTCLIEAALGLPRNRAIVIRTAGNKVCESDRGVLRSIAAGIYIKDATEILIVGHTDCAMSKFPAPEVIERFRGAGISRTAFGDEDLRSWFGAFADIKSNIVEGIHFLRRSGLVPRGMKIHGLVLDTALGSLEVVLDGDISQGADLASKAPEPVKGAVSEPAAAAVQKQAAASKGSVIIGETTAAPRPMSMHEVAATLKTLIARERGRPEFQRAISDVTAALKRERNPARVLPVLERVLRQYESEYPDVRDAFECLKRSMLEARGSAGFNYAEFIRRIFE